MTRMRHHDHSAPTKISGNTNSAPSPASAFTAMPMKSPNKAVNIPNKSRIPPGEKTARDELVRDQANPASDFV